MGMLFALFAFGLFMLAGFIILRAGYGKSKASVGVGSFKVRAAAFVVITLLGLIFAMVLLVNPNLP